MATTFSQNFIYSYPIQCFFLGFKSDTRLLQMNEWQLSVNQNPWDRTIQVAIKHSKKEIYGISNIIDDFSIPSYMTKLQAGNAPILTFSLGTDIFVSIREQVSDLQFKPINAIPISREITLNYISIKTMKWFREINDTGEEATKEQLEKFPEVIRKLKI